MDFPIMTVREFATRCGLSRAIVYKYIAEGRITTSAFLNTTVITEEEFARFQSEPRTHAPYSRKPKQ